MSCPGRFGQFGLPGRGDQSSATVSNDLELKADSSLHFRYAQGQPRWGTRDSSIRGHFFAHPETKRRRRSVTATSGIPSNPVSASNLSAGTTEIATSSEPLL
ncbi:hypothetical protein CRG98_018696 [Punica granatum]|uniref:Uncharacterized protein n=1 Tax=Punica granatum TaxID=22663 RepID=A0A2I0JX82_PUNGR|nr:hypothetical protein CRG98_018696 [Punica granatum]